MNAVVDPRKVNNEISGPYVQWDSEVHDNTVWAGKVVGDDTNPQVELRRVVNGVNILIIVSILNEIEYKKETYRVGIRESSNGAELLTWTDYYRKHAAIEEAVEKLIEIQQGVMGD